MIYTAEKIRVYQLNWNIQNLFDNLVMTKPFKPTIVIRLGGLQLVNSIWLKMAGFPALVWNALHGQRCDCHTQGIGWWYMWLEFWPFQRSGDQMRRSFSHPVIYDIIGYMDIYIHTYIYIYTYTVNSRDVYLHLLHPFALPCDFTLHPYSCTGSPMCRDRGCLHERRESLLWRGLWWDR